MTSVSDKPAERTRGARISAPGARTAAMLVGLAVLAACVPPEAAPQGDAASPAQPDTAQATQVAKAVKIPETLPPVPPAPVAMPAPPAPRMGPPEDAHKPAPDLTARPPVRATKRMVVAANPLAARAGLDILKAGGSATDAAIAAQLVLNLVEPQSSGIGGGGFLLHYDVKSGRIDTYDGRETAPAAAGPGLFLNDDGTPRRFFEVIAGGIAVGVPGLVRMMEMAHKAHGKLTWKALFGPAIRLAEDGFKVSPRLSRLLGRDKRLRRMPAARAYFFTEDGDPMAVGSLLKNPALAATFRLLAEKGADAFYAGAMAQAMVAAVNNTPENPGLLSLADLAGYKATKREPVCSFYRVWAVCGMGPPSSGGIATLQILGILQNFDLAKLKPESAQAVHLISEASRLAFADRNLYLADPDFVSVPTLRLIDPGYLGGRAKGIRMDATLGRARPGKMGRRSTRRLAPDDHAGGPSTTHLSVVDGDGNAVALTSSIQVAFGSKLLVRGFLLNNQLTDAAFRPSRDGAPVANRVAPGKRPRSSMSPTLVFDGAGKLVLVLGSPGGSRIIGFVAKTLIAALDWKLDMQAAVSLPHFINRNGPVELERGTAITGLKGALEDLGHRVREGGMTSGLHAIRVTKDGLEGGADPRREGIAVGD